VKPALDIGRELVENVDKSVNRIVSDAANEVADPV
jgi:hypothetical protein